MRVAGRARSAEDEVLEQLADGCARIFKILSIKSHAAVRNGLTRSGAFLGAAERGPSGKRVADTLFTPTFTLR